MSTPAILDDFDLESDPLGRIDLIATWKTLWAKLKAYRKTGLTPPLAERVDCLYQTRLVRLMRDFESSPDALVELVDHLACATNLVTGRRETAEFAARWTMLRDLLETYRITVASERGAAV